MRFLADMGRKQAGDQPSAPTAWGLAPGQHLGPYRTAWDVERAVRQGIERVTWVFRAMDVIASNAVKPPATARKDDRERGKVVPDHVVAGLLNAFTNPAEMAAIFRYRLSMQLQLSKKGAFVEIQRDRLGRIIALYLLPPEHTYPVPDPKTFISGFEVRIPGLPIEQLPPERVCWVRTKPHPTRPYEQLTWIEAAGIAIDIDFLLHVYNRNFVRNDKRPGLVLAVSGGMDHEEAVDLKQRVESHQGGLEIIDADQAKLVDMALTARDFQFIEAGKATKEEIQLASGVPEGMMGNTSGRTYANAATEKDTFWEEVMFSHLGMSFGCLDQIDGDSTTFLVPDYEALGILMQDKIVAQGAMLAEVSAGTRSREEYRFATGQDPSGVPDMGKYFVPLTITPIGSAPPPAPAGLQPGAPGAKAVCSCPTNEEGGMLEAKHREWCPVAIEEHVGVLQIMTARKMAQRPLDPHDPAVRAELKSARASELAADRKMLVRELRRHFAREERVVVAKILGSKGSAPKADKLFDLTKWKKQLAEDFTPVLEELYTAWGERTIAQFSKAARDTETKAEGEPFDVHDPGVTERILAQTNRLVGVEDTTYADIQEALAAGEADGDSIPALAARISGIFDTAGQSRAETIARTEVLSAANGASVEAAAQDGTVQQKEWLSAQDDRVRGLRPSDQFDHVDADGQQVGLDEAFDVSGETLEYPGDPAGSPGNVINCRCTVVFV